MRINNIKELKAKLNKGFKKRRIEAEINNYYTDEIVQKLKNISELLAISLSYLDYHVDMKKSVLPYISLPVDT